MMKNWDGKSFNRYRVYQEVFDIPTSYLVQIFDWDRGSQYMYLHNTTLERGNNTLCMSAGQCNLENPTYDMVKFFCNLTKYKVSKWPLIKNLIESSISMPLLEKIKSGNNYCGLRDEKQIQDFVPTSDRKAIFWTESILKLLKNRDLFQNLRSTNSNDIKILGQFHTPEHDDCDDYLESIADKLESRWNIQKKKRKSDDFDDSEDSDSGEDTVRCCYSYFHHLIHFYYFDLYLSRKIHHSNSHNLHNHTSKTYMNNIPHFVKPKAATEILGVSDETLRRWSAAGKIEWIRSPGGYKLYNVEKFIDPKVEKAKEVNRRSIVYCRVSSHKQKNQGDLQRQIDEMQSKYPKHQLVTDVGSGINFKRQGLKRILQLVFRGLVEEVVVGYRDRLCRFAFDLFEFIFECHNTRITVENQMDLSPDEELTEDLLAIITVFSCKHNGMRRYRKTIGNESDEDETVSDEKTMSNTKKVGESQSISVQQSTESRKRRRETNKKVEEYDSVGEDDL